MGRLRTRNAILVVIFTLSTTSFFVHYTVNRARSSKIQRSLFLKELAEQNLTTALPLSGDTTNTTAVYETITKVVIQNTGGAALLGKMDVDFELSERNYWVHLGEDHPVNASSRFLGNFTSDFNLTTYNVAVVHGPRNSTRVERVAIVIPFRDRESHLRMFLGHTLPVLRRQGNTFGIFVVEQIGNDTFNKGRVMNSGFKYARTVGEKLDMPFDCFIFQDVDTLIENDNLLYRCSKGDLVDHLSTSISKFEYNTLCCGMTVGGVLGMTSDQYEKVNGFPNNFWGWGGEDDALHARIKKKGLEIVRPNPELGRFTMIKHDSDRLNPYNDGVYKALRKSTQAMDNDGLNSLDTAVEEVEKYATFVKVRVNVGRPQ